MKCTAWRVEWLWGWTAKREVAGSNHRSSFGLCFIFNIFSKYLISVVKKYFWFEHLTPGSNIYFSSFNIKYLGQTCLSGNVVLFVTFKIQFIEEDKSKDGILLSGMARQYAWNRFACVRMGFQCCSFRIKSSTGFMQPLSNAFTFPIHQGATYNYQEYYVYKHAL